MTGDCHVRFYERRGVRLPPATHPIVRTGDAAAIASRPKRASAEARLRRPLVAQSSQNPRA